MKHIILIIAAVFFGGGFLAFHATPSVAGETTGVIVVDMQGDFTTWKNGSLAVNGSDKAFVDKVKAATRALSEKGYLIFATQDWHPADHMSFFSNHPGKKPFEVIQVDGRTQVLWPPHCVQGTENARVLVDNNRFMAVVKKGKDPKYDSYSGFQDDGGAKTEMDSILKRNGVQKLIVYGIATDYCVKATAIDAVQAGYDVTVIEELCKGVAPDTSVKALQEMKDKGITLVKALPL
ncbi:bifunctional nicotinamidase/pyrazinamidase [Desulfobacula sp.]|uniref:bifunctional nicotinamidase/pyrazinamidase n=1 Tax=Desulfobacula sp. TaxID=2593537 RepID=UPI00260675A6|nr:bifunctional nicotinamidase/pyrazinamidase [Desulfobacula sp.]